ncbi:hypothetical protein WN55_00188 [Dufourea novaeangliae]|uniref:Uncharacterized protein n=1 Tax=Dufourea novaeangliae TaxID=178035 RepID=A0A154PC90_DUFNO|nr:hypothetical protein WN55_00188 [Dufourea novaeangliae]
MTRTSKFGTNLENPPREIKIEQTRSDRKLAARFQSSPVEFYDRSSKILRPRDKSDRLQGVDFP